MVAGATCSPPTRWPPSRSSRRSGYRPTPTRGPTVTLAPADSSREPPIPNRILVVGISGTGKTRLASRLGAALGHPVLHLDHVFWNENWQEHDASVVTETIADLLRQDQWVMEGYVEPLGRDRGERAGVDVYLDDRGPVAGWGAMQR